MKSYRHSGEGTSSGGDTHIKVPKIDAPLSVNQVEILSHWAKHSILEPDQNGRAKVRVDIMKRSLLNCLEYSF